MRAANGCMRSHIATKTVTAAFDAAARTSDRRNGPCRVSAPQRTAPEDGKGRGVGSRCTTRRSSPFFSRVTSNGRDFRAANGCMRSHIATKTATAAFDAAARTSDRRNGPCRVSAPQRTAPEEGKGRGVGERAQLHGDDLEDLHSPAGALRSVGGARPDRLSEVRPQEQVQRHTADQIVDAVPGLPTLDVPVPLMVEQLADVLKQFDVQVREQAIDVPKIFIEDILARTLVRKPQLAEPPRRGFNNFMLVFSLSSWCA